jgi:hypothetical protein
VLLVVVGLLPARKKEHPLVVEVLLADFLLSTQ